MYFLCLPGVPKIYQEVLVTIGTNILYTLKTFSLTKTNPEIIDPKDMTAQKLSRNKMKMLQILQDLK